jgi:hypothetical protein
MVKRFWILDLRFWIDPVHKGTGLGDFRLSILDLFRPNMAGLEPKNNSIFQNPKSQIGTVNGQWSMVKGQWSMVKGQWSMVKGQWLKNSLLWTIDT